MSLSGPNNSDVRRAQWKVVRDADFPISMIFKVNIATE